MKILIVDDEVNIAHGIRSMLLANLSFAVSVRCASSASDAIDQAAQFKPDLLITDIRMPRMSGLELIDQLEAARLCTHYVILSGYEDFNYAQEAIRKGVADYLTKPVEKEYLLSMCTRFNNQLQQVCLRQQDIDLPEYEFLKWDPYQDEYPESLKKIIRFIEQNYMKSDLSGSSISDALFFHHSYISQLIGKHTDMNLSGIIAYFRLKKAMELLLAPQNYRVSEVSQLVGFSSERQLYKVFQKYLFCTPVTFKHTCEQEFPAK
ncbi:response regulator [Oscillospiraceae bacterium HV4-5-C5C]|nr:response regulator [Oscillospiraceae bacterium HV4-5-C5C]